MKKMSWSLILLAAMACNAQAQRQEPAPTPPPIGDDAPQEPPRRPPPPNGEETERALRDRLRWLEDHIRALKAGIDRKDATEEQRNERRVELENAKTQWNEVFAAARRHQYEWTSRIETSRRLEAEIHELESAIENKDVTPEQRQKLTQKLNFARNEMQMLRAKMESEDERLMEPRNVPDRLVARLREIEDLLKKGVGPEDQRELMAERRKIQDELQRRGGPQGPPMDPEMAKRMEEMGKLERETQELGAKLRRLPPESKDDRAEVMAKLKEAVTKLFDLREQMRAREVEMLKRRLEELTRMLEKRKASRDQIIEKRIKQLSGEADELDW